MKQRKPILSLDFDGVIHSYTSGWQGPRTIPDPPVEGALRFIVEALRVFDVQIFSSRSKYWGGRRAMQKWLRYHYTAVVSENEEGWKTAPEWWAREVLKNAFVDPWKDEVNWGVKALVKRIGFPRAKPPAMVTLDDRGLLFNGIFPTPEELLEFEPWYKQGPMKG